MMGADREWGMEEAVDLSAAWAAADTAAGAAQRAEAVVLKALESVREQHDVRVILVSEKSLLQRWLAAAKGPRARGVLETAIKRVDEALDYLERVGNAIESERTAREGEAAAKRVRECIRDQREWLAEIRDSADQRVARLIAARVANLEAAEELSQARQRAAVRVQPRWGLGR